MNKSLNPNIQRLIAPVISFIVLAFLFILSFKIGIAKIQEQATETEKLNKAIDILKVKEEILTKVESTFVSKGQFFSLTLPDTNPVLTVFSQLKISSAQLGLIMQNLKAGSEVKNKNISSTDISFTLAGNLIQTLVFLNNIRNLAPLMTISKIQIGQMNEIAQSNIVITAYWAALPIKIPAVGDSVTDLTKEETAAMDKIIKLDMPQFSVLPSETVTGRTNPF
jgi:Tfp pilus assembly protein PilO